MDLQHVTVPELHGPVSFLYHSLAAASLTRSTLSLNSSNQSILASPYAFVANQPNYQCSVEIYSYQLTKFPPADGYTILFADTLNSSNVSFSSHEVEFR